MTTTEKTTPSVEELQIQLVQVYDEIASRMRRQGYGKRVGFGRRPAALVIDFIRGFTDPTGPLGSSETDAAVRSTRVLLDKAREVGMPVFLVTSSYDAACLEAGAWELKVDHSGLTHGSPWVAFDERLGSAASDQIVVKKYPSCFFSTDLASRLVSQQIDTVFLAGTTTSGCIRASAVDACCSGFRTMVVEECVSDRFILPHRASLFDIEMKYGDIVSLEQTLTYLSAINRPRISAAGTQS